MLRNQSIDYLQQYKRKLFNGTQSFYEKKITFQNLKEA